MSFPLHIARILDDYAVAPDTKAALLDLYLQLGARVLESFSDVAERFGSASEIRPEDLASLRSLVVQRYLADCHPQWLGGCPTGSFYSPRFAEGRGNGLCSPLGLIGSENDSEFARGVANATKAMLEDGQAVPRGILLLSRNAHYGGREETISFDVVADDLDDAIDVGLAAGRQHTAPGSLGETSGTFDAARKLALIWEIQPNAWKPQGERNRRIAKVFRRNRNWHLATLVAAIRWLDGAGASIFVLRGQALQATHEVNPLEPVTGNTVELHDRTVTRVAEGLGAELREPTRREAADVGASRLMNTGLGKYADANGIASAMWRLVLPAA